MVEQSAVNRSVRGSNPLGGVFFLKEVQNARDYCCYYDCPLVAGFNYFEHYGRIHSYPSCYCDLDDLDSYHSRLKTVTTFGELFFLPGV